MRKGFSFVEILIVALVLSLTIVSYLGLTGRETRWTHDLRHRANAVSLVNNLFALFCLLPNTALLAGTSTPRDPRFSHDTDEVFTVQVLSGGTWADPAWTTRGGQAALGQLEPWVRAREVNLDIVFTVKPRTSPSGPRADYDVGRMLCSVSWKSTKGGRRCLELTRVSPL